MEDAIAHALSKLDYTELRTNQEKVVKEFLNGNDVFVNLPTGSGKSLCYCLLPLAFDFLRRKKREEEENPDPDTCTASPKSIVLVVSPLIALMKNQVKAMQERNVSSLYAGDMDEKARHEVCSGKYQLIFISPESLTSSDWWRDVLLSPVYQDNLVGFVIDEAHLVKQW